MTNYHFNILVSNPFPDILNFVIKADERLRSVFQNEIKSFVGTHFLHSKLFSGSFKILFQLKTTRKDEDCNQCDQILPLLLNVKKLWQF